MQGRRLAAVLGIALCVAVSATAFASPASAKVRVVRVGLYDNEPKVFTGEDGEPSGIFIDLLEEIAEEEGWELEYVSGSWSEGLSGLGAGEIDLMPDVGYTSERDRLYDFHKTPVVESWSYVYVASGRRIDRLSHLEGKRVAVLEGSVQETVFRQMVDGFDLDVTIVATDSLRDAFGLVRDGEADAAIANYLFGDYFSRTYSLQKTPIVFNAIPLYYAVANGRNADLLEAIDGHLGAWIEQPGSVYYETLRHYTVADEERASFRDVLWVVGGAAVLLVGAIGWISLLRWQVSVRTRHLVEAQAELEDHRAQLEELVEKRTAQLAAANERLALASQSKSDFLALMSSQLRTQLSSIISLSKLVLSDAQDVLHENQTRKLALINQAGTQLLRLTTNVLSLARIEAGGVEVTRAPFDVAGLAREVVDALSEQAKERGLTLSAEVPAGEVMIVSDERIVRQILLNLVDNALKFTEEGFVIVALSDRGHEVALSVRDTGRGIDPGDIVNLFTEFWQGPPATREEDRGTGLGLSIASRMAALIDAGLDVMSIPKRGSTFTLTFSSVPGTPAP